MNICIMQLTKLSQKKMGTSGTIHHVQSGFLAAKLADLGLFQGNTVEVLYKAPFGDPLAVEVGGTVVSLRLEEADWITVEA